MYKYRKVLFPTNDNQYPTLFLNESNIYWLIDKQGCLTGDGFDGKEDVLKYYPNAKLDDAEFVVEVGKGL